MSSNSNVEVLPGRLVQLHDGTRRRSMERVRRIDKEELLKCYLLVKCWIVTLNRLPSTMSTESCPITHRMPSCLRPAAPERVQTQSDRFLKRSFPSLRSRAFHSRCSCAALRGTTPTLFGPQKQQIIGTNSLPTPLS